MQPRKRVTWIGAAVAVASYAAQHLGLLHLSNTVQDVILFVCLGVTSVGASVIGGPNGTDA